MVDVADRRVRGPGERLGELTYEELLAEGDPAFPPLYPADEWQAVALGYTSGTTGRPKGVVDPPPRRLSERDRRHPGLGDGPEPGLPLDPADVPLQRLVLPLGGGLAGRDPGMPAPGRAGAIYAAIAEHQVTHLCGAPVVMGMIINAPPEQRRAFEHRVNMMTAASAPPAAVLQAMAALNIKVTHAYGLTEVYGPATVCAWQNAWEGLPAPEQARLQARQGVRYPVLEGLEVMDPESMQPVARDGQTIGEIMMRGHVVMKGYLKNPEATAAAFAGGWFHTGDLAVMHADGYVEIKDRSKDIIISGGENISSIEIEGALYRHPAVLEAAVVARPDSKWGETPCAFVTLKAGMTVSEQELSTTAAQFSPTSNARRTVIFAELPKTSTGKIQKNLLRERARAL